MNTFGLAGADDHVGERSASFQDEHGILFTGLSLALTHIACCLSLVLKDAPHPTSNVQTRT
jgi:hypothetical protein